MQRLLIVSCLLLLYGAAWAQRATVSGYIRDAATGETLIGAAVTVRGTRLGAVSNEYGFYTLTLEAGEKSMEYSYIGYGTVGVDIALARDTTVNVALPADAALEAATVTALSESGVMSPYIGSVDIPQSLIRNAPAILGESDVIKVLQTVPGVQPGMAGFSALHVRGGGADENLIMLDGTPLYNVNHMMGLFSVFTPEAVKKVTLYKGAYPARYGGRVSSVVDVRTIDGNGSGLHGTFSVGMLCDKLFLEGPVGSKGTTFSAGVRGMHTFVLDPLIHALGSPANYAFYDINAKISHRFSDRDRVWVALYHGRDYVKVSDEQTYDSSYGTGEHLTKPLSDENDLHLRWGNSVLTARWTHVFSSRLFAGVSASSNNYMMRFGVSSKERELEDGVVRGNQAEYRYDSGIGDAGLRIDFDYTPSPGHLIRFGAEGVNHVFRPETSKSTVKDSEDGKPVSDRTVNNESSRRITGQEYSLYVEDDISIGERLGVVPGVHMSLFRVRGRAYFRPEPRLAAKYDFTSGLSARAGYARMSQYVHQLNTGSLSLPTDLWVPITEDISPVTSDTWSAGLSYAGLPGWEMSVEAYWKELRNVLEYRDGRAAFSASGNWEDNVEEGRGSSRGVELYLRKTAGKTTGGISYTLSKSDRRFPDGSINGGRTFPFKYDRRHTANVSITRRLGKRIDLGASWSGMSGYWITVPERQMAALNPDGSGDWTEVSYVPSRNNWKTPPSHHLDLSFNIHKKLRRGERTWNISVTNVYNARNPDWCIYDEREIKHTAPDGSVSYEYTPAVHIISYLCILPSFSYTYKF